MTGRQQTLGDCEPLWHDWDQLCQRGAEEMHDPADRQWRDLKGQRITKRQYHRIQTVHVQGDLL
ncbi:hypothetical protein ABZ636_03775 [Streptomyces sp. NPDC007251]|uniref:hypothetical protein n=1 Tax=Streptomyces sp. NPDC007251 TaxID=3154483 RepID=UPI0033E2245F